MPQKHRTFLAHFFRTGGWVAPLVLLFAAGLLIAGLATRAERLELARYGTTGAAEIVRKYSRLERSGSSHGSHRRYYVEYRFTPPGGAVASGRKSVSFAYYDAVNPGDRRAVLYSSRDPAVAELEGPPGRASELAMEAFGGLLAVAGLAVVAWARGRAAGLVWMQRNGLPRPAEVIRHDRTGIRVNKRPLWRAVWRQDDGTEGQSAAQRPENLPGIGSRITVMVDPERHRPAVWEGDL